MKRYVVLLALVGLVAALGLGCAGGTTANGGGGGGDTDYETGATFPTQEEIDKFPKSVNPGASQSLPASVSLAANLPPIGDQGQQGSCTAWGTGYAMKSYQEAVKRSWSPAQAAHQASPAFLYAYTLAEQGSSCGDGTDPKIACDVLVKQGCSSLATVPYSDLACTFNAATTDAGTFRIDSYKMVVPTDRNAMKTELANGNVIVWGAELYDDFMNWTGSGVYTGSGTYLGEGSQHAAHCMAIVGYDDAKGAYRVMNSWGSGWGDAGYIWMDYDTVETTSILALVAESAGQNDPTPPAPDPTPDPGDSPTGEITYATQFWDWMTGYVYLYFEWEFDEPIYIQTIDVLTPDGLSSPQTYDAWFTEGYVYWYRNDGYQFLEGDYQLTFQVEDLNGASWTLSGTTYVGPLAAGASVKVRGRDVDQPVTTRDVKAKPFAEGAVHGMNQKPVEVVGD